ncbi:MAG: rRNA adenine dimethyltransferase family protein [Candidatus Gracilibacteria bacterium]
MSFEILAKYGIKAKKSLGQNFLVDENILDTIAITLDITGKNVLEIGPGYGSLTEKLLLQKPKSLHLVELDKNMIEILKDRVNNGEFKLQGTDFQIFNEDVLKFDVKFEKPCHCESNEAIQKTLLSEKNGLLHTSQGQNSKNYYLIANIPYYITSPILQKFLYNIENKPEKMLILMQKDVGDKILAGQNSCHCESNEAIQKTLLSEKNGLLCRTSSQGQIKKKQKNKSSVLSLFIAKKSYVNEVILVPARSFIPAPKVESSVLLFETHDNYKEIDDKEFMKFIKIGFQEPRKKLINNLVKGGIEKETVLEIFKTLGFTENIRGEDLSTDEWIELFKKIYV